MRPIFITHPANLPGEGGIWLNINLIESFTKMSDKGGTIIKMESGEIYYDARSIEAFHTVICNASVYR